MDCVAIDRSCDATATCVNAATLTDGSVDDSTLVVTSQERGLQVRADLQRRIWGSVGLPGPVEPVEAVSVATDPFGTTGADTVERVSFELPGDYTTHVYVVRPASPTGQVVVLHQGHWHTLKEGRLDEVAQRALDDGATVVGLTMPLFGDNTGPVPTHDDLVAAFPDSLPGHALQVFVSPVAAALDYVAAQQVVEDVTMVGISGGGWTTVLYAALDPRVDVSVPVAGSVPLFQRSGLDWGDAEQSSAAVYEVAG